MAPVTFHLPEYLAPFADGRRSVRLSGAFTTAGEALAGLHARYPGVAERILTETGEVREHVNIFVREESIRMGKGLRTQVGAGEEIYVIAAVSGG